MTERRTWCSHVWRSEFALGWERQRFFHEIEVAALICPLVDLSHESVVEGEDWGEVFFSPPKNYIGLFFSDSVRRLKNGAT